MSSYTKRRLRTLSLLIVISGSSVTVNMSSRNAFASLTKQSETLTDSSATNNNPAAAGGQGMVGDYQQCPKQTEKRVLDVFSDITFTPLKDNKITEDHFLYSSVHCFGTGTREVGRQSEAESKNARRPNFINRSCQYKNLYYRISDQTFHYFPSPIERNARSRYFDAGKESAQELISRRQVTLGTVEDLMRRDKLKKYKVVPWSPLFHDDERQLDLPINVTSVAGPWNAKFLLYQPFHGMNVGHLIWDDILTLFSLLHNFGYAHQDHSDITPIPFFVEIPDHKRNYGGHDPGYRCHPSNPQKYKKCVKMFRKFLPELLGISPDKCSGDVMRTGNWLLGEDKIGKWNGHPKEPCDVNRTNLPPRGADYILLPEVLAGTGRLAFFGCEGDCSIGRTTQWLHFRNFMLRNLFGPSRGCQLSQEAPAGYITFSLPGGSTRPGLVYFFEEEIKLAKARYGVDVVRVVDMATISIQEQAELVRNSVVFLTNHGGGGVVSIFAPQGAAIFVYWHGSRRFEANFYESAGYFRTTWVGIEERNYTERTMAMIDAEVEKSSLIWPENLAAKVQTSGQYVPGSFRVPEANITSNAAPIIGDDKIAVSRNVSNLAGLSEANITSNAEPIVSDDKIAVSRNVSNLASRYKEVTAEAR